MSIRSKLQIGVGHSTAVLRLPAGVDLGVDMADDPNSADAAVLFITTAADLESDEGRLLLDAARRDAVSWVAYPKAGQLGTDLNRDSLAALLSAQGLRPVRQIAIDDVWSALRFRPSSGPR